MSLVVTIVKIPSDRSTPSRQLSRQSKVSGGTSVRPLSPSESPSFGCDTIIGIIPKFLRDTFSRPWKTLSMSSMRAMHGTFICMSAQERMSSWLPISARL